MKPAGLLLASLVLAAPAPALAGELFGGLYVHDIKTPLTLSGFEPGLDAMVGYRGGRIGRLPLRPYVFAAVNTAGATNYAAAGLSARFGRRWYVRPGLGLAAHTGSAKQYQDPFNGQVDFGSRLLFEPEFAVGVDLSRRLSVEASYVHLSHAQLFGPQNPGMDNIGVRMNLKL